MYKRRKKITPVASSTMVNEKSGNLTQSSQSTAISSIENRSDSPEDIFSQSPPRSSSSGGSTTASRSITNDLSKISQNVGTGDVQKPKNTSSQVLQMLMTSDDSEELEPVVKKAKTNGVATEKLVLSQTVNVGPLKYFHELLLNSGLKLGLNGEQNTLRKSQYAFIRNLTKALERNSELSNVDKFIENLEKYLSANDNLKAALSPTKSQPDLNLPGESQESFIQLLLQVEVLQHKVIAFLLDKVAEYAVVSDEEGSDEPLAIVRMILHSMRYLTKVSHPESLTQKLFDLIHSVGSSMLKHEIINCLPDIISDTQRKKAADELMELMKCEPHLSPSILFTLSNLWLEPDSLYELQMGLIKNLRKTSLDQLPAFVRFITMGDIVSHADDIINGLRSELVICQAETSCTQAKQASSSEVSSTIFLIFEKLRDSVLKSKKLADLWLKNIGKVKSASYHKPIDILMLMILHSMTTDQARKKSVEAVFKNKIKIGHFKEPLVEDTLSVGLVLIKEHFSGLLKLLSSLLLSPDLTVSNYASFFYTECFIKLDAMMRKMIILELKESVNMSKANAKPALSLLYNLADKHVDKVAPYFTLIMLLLDSVREMRVFEVRQLMEVLCMIAFGDTGNPSFDNDSIQDELCIIAQKQLSRPDPCIFRSGIVSGVVIIKHMVKNTGVNETPNSEEEDIPLSPMARKAFDLFELVMLSTRNSAEAQVIVFDQFFHMIMSSDHMDKYFMKKVSIVMQNLLQKHFMISSSEFLSKDNGLDSSLQFCIDTCFEDPIVLNLVDAVVAEVNSSQVQLPAVALPGLVRVIRGLELADLTEIDALLGCAIALPSPQIYSKFSSVEPFVQRLALDCLFHVANWMREILNSFVYLIKEKKPEKILMRLRALVYFQKVISLCLPQAMAYSPPKYYFDQNSGKTSSNVDKPVRTAGGRKRQKKGGKKAASERTVDGEENEEGEEAAAESEEEPEVEPVPVAFSSFKQNLRELDFDVCLALTQPLVLTPTPIKDGDCSAELGPSELLLLLDDLNAKLRYCLGPKKTTFLRAKEPVGFDNFSTISVDLIVRNTSKLSHHLTIHLQKIVEYLHNLLSLHDGIIDAQGMFCPGSDEIKQCLSLILNIFNTYISWPDLESETYLKCLLKCLVKLGGPHIEKNDCITKNTAIRGALTYLKEISKCIQDLTSAVSLVNLMKTLIYIQDDEEERTDINLGDLCYTLLTRKWYDAKGVEAKGSAVNQQLSVLLDIYFGDEANSLENITKVLATIPLEVESMTGDNSLTTFPHFNKSNLNCLIRSITKGLLAGLKRHIEGNKDLTKQLEIWDGAINNLQALISVIKVQDSRVNLRQFLKGSLPILRYFISNGMNVCSIMFKLEPVAVSQAIKKLQVVTRYIQSICNYSKVNKDGSLIHQLPGIRGTLETILLSVKNMILQNKCAGAFFMGSMRHKDIHGEIINTQDGEEGTEELATATEETSNAQETSGGDESDSSEGGSSMSDAC